VLKSTLHLYPKAIACWRRLETELQADFELEITGGLAVAETPEQLAFLERKTHEERALGLDVELIGQSELRHIAPYLDTALLGAEFCALEGKVNPLRANAALRKAAVARGVHIVDSVAVQRIRPEGRGFVVLTAAGDLPCGQVVIASGGGSHGLAEALGLSMRGSPSALHMNATEPVAPVIRHLVQHSELAITLKQQAGGNVIIGGGWAAHLPATRNMAGVRLDSIIGSNTLAAHLVPQIASARVVRSWAGVNTTVDGLSLVGEVPSIRGLHFAVPGFAGYTLGPLIARLVADCVLGRAPAEDIAPYSIERFQRAA
jgi:glycine/D-amino acid oxidase-like deaminating enzyme